MRPDRIILGSDDARAIAALRQLYAPFQRNRERIIVMGVRSAELTKYAANAMLATRISFMNEVANLAEALGADIEEVRRGIGSDPRIGYQFLYAGAGFGGSCFPKDVKALQRSADEAGRPLRLLAAVEEVNQAQKHVFAEKIRARFGGSLSGKTIALWGLAFKANTDDMREAPSLTLIDDLTQGGILHGGVLASLIDSVCACAAMARTYPQNYTTTINLQVAYTMPVSRGRVRAVGKCLREGGRVLVCEAHVWNEEGQLGGNGAFQLLRITIPESR
jgi:nucleotide sugar dehydrogenase